MPGPLNYIEVSIFFGKKLTFLGKNSAFIQSISTRAVLKIC